MLRVLLAAWPHSTRAAATPLGSDLQSDQRRTGDDLQGRTELLRAALRPPWRQRQCQQDAAGQAPRGVRGGHERDGTGDPIQELSRNGGGPAADKKLERPSLCKET